MYMPPEVIIHNSITLDNCFTADAFSKKSVDIGIHYTVLLSFSPDALLVGSGSATEGLKLSGDFFLPEEEKDFKKPEEEKDECRPYGIFADSRGQLINKLHFYRNLSHIRDAIVIVSNKTPKEYICYLKERDYSYIVAGEDEIDFKTALVKLGEIFGFKRIISDSGSILNGVLINEGIPSKLSLLTYPEIAGENYRKLFENVTVSMEFELLKTECKENGIIHCLYSVQKQKN